MNERNTRITMLAFASDYISWSVGMAFAGTTTVMPTFVRHFTDSSVIIGLINVIQTGVWLVPQLIVSNMIVHHERKKPLMVGTGLIYRYLPWLFALYLVLNPSAPGMTTLVVFYAGYVLFNLGDSISTVPWFDIMGKSVPPTRRGRMMGGAQIVAGLLAVVAGQIVTVILSPDGPPFPLNYALCFALMGTGVMLSWLSCTFVHEVVQPVAAERLAFKDYLPGLLRVLQHDKHFGRLTLARLIAGMANMALPFYIIFGTDVLRFAPETIGLFVSAQVLGGLLAGTVLGYLNERSGSRAAIIASISIQLLAPLLALLVFWGGAGLGSLEPWAYALVFVAVGVGQSSGILGFAPETIGLFVSAQVLGGLLAGTVLGYLNERSGSRAAIIASISIQLLAPLLALLVFWGGAGLGSLEPWAYALVFVAVGVGQSSGILGFINYVLELAPPQERVTYVGLTNTLSGVLLFAPFIGAWAIQTVSYTGMFALVIVLLAASLFIALTLTEPRKKAFAIPDLTLEP